MRWRLRLTLALGWGVCSLCGCQQGKESLPPEPVLHPVSGKITAGGKPLVHAVVTFLQVDERGTTSVGETNEEGVYELSYVTKPGTAAATYKVAVSYLKGTDGTVYGLAPRSGLSKPYGMITAKELVPPEWSDLGRTKHVVTVPDNGGTFNFDITEPLLPSPAPDPHAQGDQSKHGSEPGKVKSPGPPTKENGSGKPAPPSPATKPVADESSKAKSP
jgi:hypothetical protein